MEPQKTKAVFSKNTTAGGICTLIDFKIYYKDTVINQNRIGLA